MIPRDWITLEDVEREMTRAGIACGLPAEEIRDVTRRAIKDGQKKPHDPLAEDIITEDSAALEFADQHGNELLFDHDAGSWYQWISSHWAREKTGLAFDWARVLARKLSEGES